MNTTKAKELINKFHEGILSSEEEALLDGWYLSLSKDEQASITDENLQGRKLAVLGRLDRAYNKRLNVKLWQRITGVAAAVTAITLGIWLYYASSINDRHPALVSGSQYTNDIAPGKNRATLTLANGKTINLSDAKTGVVIGDDKLAYNDGSPLSPQGGSLPGGERSRVQTLTASTPRGGTYQITLPDGTKVWLNADSRISFPSQFSGKQRRILLSGEAYFEVSQNKRMPFVVESNGQQVEVLGTHFNITAYKDETSTKTTLLEGSVRVAFGSPSASRSSLPRGEMVSAREGNTREGSKNNSNPLSPQGGSLPGGGRSIVLKPNQQATFLSLSGRDGEARTHKITVTQVDPNIAIDWKNGQFIFESEPLPSILRKVARWYNVSIVYANTSKNNTTFSGVVSRADNVSSVLRMLQKTSKIKFSISGNTVTVE